MMTCRWSDVYNDPLKHANFTIQLRSLPYDYVLNGNEMARQSAWNLLNCSRTMGFTESLQRTYADFLICGKAFWELLASDIQPMSEDFTQPREASIIGIVHLPADKLEQVGDLYCYDGSSKMFFIHPSRVLDFISLLGEDETLTVEVFLTLIERGINSILQDVTFKFEKKEAQEDFSIVRS